MIVNAYTNTRRHQAQDKFLNELVREEEPDEDEGVLPLDLADAVDLETAEENGHRVDDAETHVDRIRSRDKTLAVEDEGHVEVLQRVDEVGDQSHRQRGLQRVVQTQHQHVRRDHKQDAVHAVEDGRKSRNALVGGKVAVLARTLDHGDDRDHVDDHQGNVDDEKRKRRRPPWHASHSVDAETDER